MCAPLQDAEDIFDGSHVAGASRGRIEGGGVAGPGIGTILQVALSFVPVDLPICKSVLGESRDGIPRELWRHNTCYVSALAYLEA